MCGVFGFVSKNGDGPDLTKLARIATVTERRGPHAFGFAWVDDRGRLRMFKQTGRISRNLDALHMMSTARMLIGHCRYATHGDYNNNLNNHPHPADGGWIVHNGQLPAHRMINDSYGLAPVSDCDSETLGLLIETLSGTLVERCTSAAEIGAGEMPLAMLGLWRNPQRLIAVCDGNPLHVAHTDQAIYLASLAHHMPGRIERVADGMAISFRFRNGNLWVDSDSFGIEEIPASEFLF